MGKIIIIIIINWRRWLHQNPSLDWLIDLLITINLRIGFFASPSLYLHLILLYPLESDLDLIWIRVLFFLVSFLFTHWQKKTLFCIDKKKKNKTIVYTRQTEWIELNCMLVIIIIWICIDGFFFWGPESTLCVCVWVDEWKTTTTTTKCMISDDEHDWNHRQTDFHWNGFFPYIFTLFTPRSVSLGSRVT